MSLSNNRVSLRSVSFAAVFIAIAVAVPLVYLPASLHFDEAIYLVIAQQMIDGQVLYQDIYDHKTPGIFVLAVLVEQLVSQFSGPLSLLAYGDGRTETATAVYTLRLLTYTVIALTGLVLYDLGRKLADSVVGMIAAIVFVTAMYTPHFVTYHFLTEPFAILPTAVAARLILVDRVRTDLLAGAALAVGVLFNQTVFLFGLAFIVYRFGGLRDPSRRTRAYLTDTVERFGAIGIGFGVPIAVVLGYYASQGLLVDVLYYSIYLPLFEYAPAYEGWGRVLATVTVLPIWLLGLVALGKITRDWLRKDLRSEWGFIALWAILIAYPGATRFSASHQLTFIFAPLALLSAAGFVWLWSWMWSPMADAAVVEQLQRLRLPIGDRIRHASDGGHTPSRVGTVILVGLAVTLLIAAGVTGLYAGNVLASTTVDQEESAQAVDELVDGPTYTWPPQMNQLYYFSDNIEPVPTYFMTIYSSSVSDQIKEDLEDHGVEYLVVAQAHVDDGGNIQADTSAWFVEEKRPMVAYLNERFEPVDETHGFVIFHHVDK